MKRQIEKNLPNLVNDDSSGERGEEE